MVFKRAKTELTEEEKFQLAVQAEKDCDRFRRQCILLERDRTQYVQGKDKTILRQKRVLNVFRNEHNNIVTDLKVATTLEKKRLDRRNIDDLHHQLSVHDTYQCRIDKMKIQLKEIDAQIKILIASVHRLENENVSDRQLDERLLTDTKALKYAENQLQIEVKKFGIFCNENRKLRELIEHLLLERRDFMKIWMKLINKLAMGKKFMLDIIEQATIACDQREEWCRKLATLRTKAHKDLLMHTDIMCNYQRKNDHEKKLELFLLIKNQKRMLRDLEAKELMKHIQWRADCEKQLAIYRRMRNDIWDFTGETDVDQIALQFMKKDNNNFMRFNYINNLNDEMERININLTNLYKRNEELMIMHNTRNAQEELKIKNLDELYETTKQETEQIDQFLADLDKQLKQILDNIVAIYGKCQCKNDELLKFLGENEQINYYNVIWYLEILESRIFNLSLVLLYNEKILTERRVKRAEVVDDEHHSTHLLPIVKVVGTNPCPLCVEHEYVSDVIDTLQKPLTREEARQKLLQRLALPDGLERLHNVSNCQLPKSREIIQRRYQ